MKNLYFEEIEKLSAMEVKIAELKYELKQIESKEKQQRDFVSKAIADNVLDMTVRDVDVWLNGIYWGNSRLAGIVKNVSVQILGRIFVPSIKKLEVICTDCENKVFAPCKSWSEYKGWHICESCANKRTEEQEKRSKMLYLNELKRQFSGGRNVVDEPQIAVVKDPELSVTQLRQLPYKEYLLTEHWQEFRKVVLKQAKYRCQLCNKSDRLDVHHRTYENLGREDIGDVIALCRGCHEKHHDKGHDDGSLTPVFGGKFDPAVFMKGHV